MAITPTGTAALGAILPFTPLAHLLGFSPLPPAFFLILLGMIVTYLALAEFAKSRFFTTEPAQARQAPASPKQWHTRRLRRRAGRFIHHGVVG